MPNHVLQVDCSSGANGVEWDQGSAVATGWFQVDVAFNATAIAAMLAASSGTNFETLGIVANGSGSTACEVEQSSGVLKWRAHNASPFTPAAPLAPLQFYTVTAHFTAGAPATLAMLVDGVAVGTDSATTVA